MCGLFGWSGKDPKKFNKTKFDILGIFNESRGTHSCGITIDGEIHIGIDANKIYKEFLVNTGYDNPIMFPTVIGHTRQSTVGTHTIDNAHPFGFGNNNGLHAFIGAHNGTLLNHIELAKKFDIERTIAVKNKNLITYRTKIDSEILLECLFKSKNYDVLSQYNGAAALLFTNTYEPNVLYCYHGKSYKDNYPTDKEVPEEERPLFYYKENKNSLYVSSLKASLKAIGGTDATIGVFEHNMVYKITDGDISKAEKTKINRYECYQTEITNYNRQCSRHFMMEYEEDDDKDLPSSEIKPKQTVLNLPERKTNDVNIYKEEPLKPMDHYKGKIYFNKLRYWRNGHLITGCYIWIPDYGFYYLGKSVKESEEMFWSLVNKSFHNGVFSNTINKKSVIPFVHDSSNEITKVHLYYFYEGIRIQTKLDYNAVLEIDQSKHLKFDYISLSECACHPIIDIEVKYKNEINQNVLLNQVVYTGTISPLGSEKIYTFLNGNCTEMKPIVNKSKDNDSTLLNQAINNILKIENEIDAADETAATTFHSIENDLLEDDINMIFNDPLKKFPRYIKTLDAYPNNTRAIKAKAILESFVKQGTTLININTLN